MATILQTDEFAAWIGGLRDQIARARIAARIRRAEAGNLGDVRPIGEGVSEMRIDHGPGYRLYFVERAGASIVLLCGGTKTRQSRDIARAKAMADELEV